MRTIRRGKFFVPPSIEGQQALDLWKQFSANAILPITDRKIRSITYMSNGQKLTSEVGVEEHDGERRGMVWAIYESAESSQPWSVCFGVFTGETIAFRDPPIMVGRRNILEVVEFEAL